LIFRVEMFTPDFLKKGDKIAIVAPARKISAEEINYAVKVFQSWGLVVVKSPNLHNSFHQFAGSDEERASDLEWAFSNSDIKAIICARGGYGTIRTLSKVDKEVILENPKWLVGYSDITALHSFLNRLGIQSIHGPMPISFETNTGDSLEILRKFLFHEIIEKYLFEGNMLNIEGEVSGDLIGGNLSVIYSLRGTKYESDFDGKILFIEDLDEYLYHIDRMMMNLKESGILEKISGLIVGDMIDMHDNSVSFGYSAKEIVYNHVKDLKIPVAFIRGIGHGKMNLPLILGRKVTLKVSKQETVLFF
jgi:muramoyltetrapeptide carboxypeptidase